MNILKVILDRYVDIEEEVSQGKLKKGAVVYLNPSTYLCARKYPNVYRQARAIRFDGILFTSLIRLFLRKDVRRQSFDFTSLAPLVIQRAADDGTSVALFGGRRGEAEVTSEYFQLLFPKLKIAGCWSGYYATDEERHNALVQVMQTKPGLILIGMGGTLQDRTAFELVRKGFCGAIHTCGGFISQTAQSGDYYPKWSKRYELRWLYRIIHEPHVRRRIVLRYPKFIGVFLWDVLQFYRHRRRGT